MKNVFLRGFPQLRLWIALLLIFTATGVLAQKSTVTGTVKDSDNVPIPGATIVEKGTTNGTVSDANGAFSINVLPNAVLVISFVGMLTQEIKVENQTTINVTLLTDAIGIEEVVAIGYGTRSKQAITGSAVNVNTDELKKMNPSNNITTALQGMVPGVVANSPNTPGAGANIQISGIGTINNTSPLVIVDGVPSDIGRLNPAEIKSMTVLKDAASTAIYGSRGANGVIVVTTVIGEKIQKPNITMNAQI